MYFGFVAFSVVWRIGSFIKLCVFCFSHCSRLTDLHRKVELGQGERYLSQRRKRHVYFNEEPEVFTFE